MTGASTTSVLAYARISEGVKPKKLARLEEYIAGYLKPGEQITHVFTQNINLLVITNGRVFAYTDTYKDDYSRACKQSVFANEIVAVTSRKKWSGMALDIERMPGGVWESYDTLGGKVDEILTVVQQLQRMGMPQEMVGAKLAEEEAAAAASAAREERAAADAAAWASVPYYGDRVNGKTQDELAKSCRPGEVPRWVIGSSAAGALAAFDDRCMIIKKGAMTNLLAGSLGGGRMTTFLYAEITGVEYNAGWLNGVLEILTPSYQGTANTDYWTGSGSGRNRNSNDPYTLSNTLPLSKSIYNTVRPRIEELKQWAAESKRVVVVAPQQPADAPGVASQPSGALAAEIQSLAALHQQGLLDDDEFKAAKAAAIHKFA